MTNKSNSISPAPLLAELAYLCILFVDRLTSVIREKEMKFSLFDGGGDGEHNGVSLVKISGIFASQDDFFRCVVLTIWQSTPGCGTVFACSRYVK